MSLKEYTYKSKDPISTAIKGKKIKSFRIDDEGMDDNMIFEFTDGTELIFRYDWIYEWRLQMSGEGRIS